MPFYNLTSYALDEVKDIVLDTMPIAQDPNNPRALTNIKTYSDYYPKLDYYLNNKQKRHKSKKVSSCDHFAYIISLSYPQEMMQGFNSFENMKFCINIYKNPDDEINEEMPEKTDFELVDYKYIMYDEEVTIENHDCICGYKKIQNIYVVENKFTKIKLHIGSECIKKHGIIPRKLFKEIEKNFKELKELIKEEKQNNKKKPIEHYKDLLIKNNFRKKNKKNLESKQYRVCIVCSLSLICVKDKNHIDKCVCHGCLTTYYGSIAHFEYYEILKLEFINNCNECSSCNKGFYSSQNRYLCAICRDKKKITVCNLCNEYFMDNIGSRDIYCDVCEKNCDTCIDCKKMCIKSQLINKKCNVCNYLFQNGLLKKNCSNCKSNFYPKKTESYQTHCKKCFIICLIEIVCVDCCKPFKKLPSYTRKIKCNGCNNK